QQIENSSAYTDLVRHLKSKKITDRDITHLVLNCILKLNNEKQSFRKIPIRQKFDVVKDLLSQENLAMYPCWVCILEYEFCAWAADQGYTSINECIQNYATCLNECDKYSQFGGGEFGGAGSSSDWEKIIDPSQRPRSSFSGPK
ncbi:MAG TPA: hypothetical protein DCM08_01260, partial [Microscillaceae bacterium]|nr:hypothetical protein [Microscillaceae bacterium]